MRVTARRSAAAGGAGRTPVAADTPQADTSPIVASPPRASIEVARWRVGRRGVLLLTLSFERDARAESDCRAVDGNAVAVVELRQDSRGGTSADWALVSRRVSRVLNRADGTMEVVLWLGDWQAWAGTCGSPALPEGIDRDDLACTLVSRGSGPALVLTDLPARLGLRGGTYVLEGVAPIGDLLANPHGN
jgi:hypothetical protein